MSLLSISDIMTLISVLYFIIFMFGIIFLANEKDFVCLLACLFFQIFLLFIHILSIHGYTARFSWLIFWATKSWNCSEVLEVPWNYSKKELSDMGEGHSSEKEVWGMWPSSPCFHASPAIHKTLIWKKKCKILLPKPIIFRKYGNSQPQKLKFGCEFCQKA